MLGATELDPHALAPRLAELRALEPVERAPILGRMKPCFAHPSAELRTAALEALVGCDGPLALDAIVHALGDGDARVCETAVRALSALAEREPARWAHALFHPRPEVRRLALAHAPRSRAASWAFYLLGSEHRDTIDARAIAVPSGAVGAVLELARENAVSRAQAEHWLLAMPWADVLAFMEATHVRPDEDVARVLASEGRRAERTDGLDELLERFWAFEPVGREKVFARLHDGVVKAPGLRRRVLAATLRAAHVHGWHLEALTCAVRSMPALLGWRTLARTMRERAAMALHHASALSPLDDEALESLLRIDLARRPTGELDLRVVGALLRFQPNHPYAWLRKRMDDADWVRAFLADPAHAAPFLWLRDDSPRGRDAVLRLLLDAGADRAELVAAIAAAASSDDLAWLVPALRAQAPAVVTRLGAIERESGSLSRELASALARPLAEEAATTVARGRTILTAWLARRDAGASRLGLWILSHLAKVLTTTRWVETIAGLPTAKLRVVLDHLHEVPELGWGAEVALAHALAGHTSTVVAAWAASRQRVAPAAPRVEIDPSVRGIRAAEARAIEIASHADLDLALAPLAGRALSDVTAPLASRASIRPHVGACAALLVAHDRLEDVARTFERYFDDDDAFVRALDDRMAEHVDRAVLPPQAHAWLWRFERHGFASVDQLLVGEAGEALARLAALPSRTLRRATWRAIASVVAIWRWRDRPRLSHLCAGTLIPVLSGALGTDVSTPAALMLGEIHAAKVAPEHFEAVRARVRAILPELDADARTALRALVDARGLAYARAGSTEADSATLARLAAAGRLDEIAAFLASDDERVVIEATLRLVQRSDEGCARIVFALRAGPTWPGPMGESLPLWPEGPALAEVRAWVEAGEGAPETRFHAALGLAERREERFVDLALDAACAPARESWLRKRDYERLCRVEVPRRVWRRLAASDHPYAYTESVSGLLAVASYDERDHEALRAFLDRGTERHRALRDVAAQRLWAWGDSSVFPLVAAMSLAPPRAAVRPLAAPATIEMARSLSLGVLFAGGAPMVARSLWAHVSDAKVDPAARTEATLPLLVHAREVWLREAAVATLPRTPGRDRKLTRVAEVFAWGLVRSRELTGRSITVHLLAGKELGWTRLDESRVRVNVLPILRGERHGAEIVEGLVLHELGHQAYHRGPEAKPVFDRAEKARLGRLLNLVADEHLERRIRAYDASYGDRLKRLAAWAFQHGEREVQVEYLLELLGARAFAVLTRTPLGAAHDTRSVSVSGGALLAEMEKNDFAFAKFVRALRMGLGSRHGDPRVDAGLALFDRGFRRRDVEGLWEIVLKLREIFGAETRLVEDFGGPESIPDDALGRATEGEGLGDAEVQREVERILGPPSGGGVPGKAGPAKLAINVGPDESFQIIRHVEAVEPDAVSHARALRDVRRHAARLRAFLLELGIRYERERMRLRGKRLDASRLRSLVTRGDPRVLVAREPRRHTDLFVGLAIDCSGSMQGRSMELAHAYGVLLAEACRGVPGIDLRIAGFTERAIFDAGDATRPAVTSLRPTSGNNDAAGLWHVAELAAASRRRARLLVMISDGLPTECSTAALRALVDRLTRGGFCCAQIAVRPLEERCFRNYVEVADADMDAAVRRFGSIVAMLVSRVLAR